MDHPTESISPTYPPAEWRLRRLTQLQQRPLPQRPVRAMPVVVPVVLAENLCMPKTSSTALTCGLRVGDGVREDHPSWRCGCSISSSVSSPAGSHLTTCSSGRRTGREAGSPRRADPRICPGRMRWTGFRHPQVPSPSRTTRTVDTTAPTAKLFRSKRGGAGKESPGPKRIRCLRRSCEARPHSSRPSSSQSDRQRGRQRPGITLSMKRGRPSSGGTGRVR
jgi:hypothetical protein